MDRPREPQGRVVPPGVQDRARSRKGVAVFIINVSKRIHPTTLREAFSEYGKIYDVYIAFNNRKRRGLRSTFAFVRFSNVLEAMNAVDLANGRLMDGFRIKTFLDRGAGKHSRSLKNSGVGALRVEKVKRREVALDKGLDERTYKEALMFNTSKGDVDGVSTKIVNECGKPCGEVGVDPLASEAVQIGLVDKDQSWLKHCLVGHINSMYDPEFVQQVLISEGFSVKVSSWSGFYVVVQFQEEEQMDIFWDLKESVLKPWFEEIDTVESFMREQKLKVWVSLEGLPLEAWSESTLFTTGSRWGRVIQIDSDSVERKRLDKARLLLGVKCLSRIPPQISVKLNGELYFLKVSSAAFEDELRWIDGSRPTSAMKNSPGGDDGELRKLWRGKESVEILESSENGDNSLTEFKTCGVGGTSAECVGLGAVGLSREEKLLELDIADGHSGLKEFPENLQKVGESFSTDQPFKEQLYEVQVDGGADSNMSSSHSVHIEPILDPVSGLYSIKPRLFTRSKRNNMVEMCSTFINRSRQVGFSPSEIKGSKRGQEVERREDRYEVQGGKEDVGKLNQLGDLRLAEAEASLEVCEKLGLNFNEKREMILNRFVEVCVLFIQESKLRLVNSKTVRQISGSTNKYNFSFIASEGAAGGLISLWDPVFFKCESVVGSKNYIVLIGTLAKQDFKCALINVYGPHDVGERSQMFDNLSKCIFDLQVPVIVGGDFNVVRTKEEKIGVSFHKKTMREFSDFIETMSLVDIPLSGGRFTWSNFREDPSFSRLDRFLISAEVLMLWSDVIQSILPKSISDHNPLRRKGESKARIKEVEELCEVIERRIAAGIAVPSSVSELKEARGKLWALIRREEREWIQKSRIKWAVEGDRNTKFFHLTASIRRRNNFIGTIQVGDDVFTNPGSIRKVIGEHFKKMYNGSKAIPLKSFDCEMGHISSEEVARIEREFLEKEIWEALSALDSSKAPGPDGFNMGFLKRFWSSLKVEILNFFGSFFKGEMSDLSFNQSFVVLIPKRSNPVLIEDYRPISLVGCVYKLLSKVLAVRLREVMDRVIGVQQFAFCPGRQILDCSLIANEVIDHHKRKKLEGVIFKADFYKAYDTVDWGFLLFILKKLGFGSRWCQWIYSCISSASVSILVNGSPTVPFAIGRGLRQGCPLSPLLFNLVAEALSALLRKAIRLGFFSGFHIGQKAVEISHLQFADDLIVFCEASMTKIKNIVRILRGFEIAAGLKLNLSKTSLLGVNVDEKCSEQLGGGN
ncbi:hypothetical protein GQ457_18G015870 [Hibiscus cannabinus]